MQPVMPWLFARLGLAFPVSEGWWRTALLAAGTVAGAAAAWHGLERPIDELKRRFPYRAAAGRAGLADRPRRVVRPVAVAGSRPG